MKLLTALAALTLMMLFTAACTTAPKKDLALEQVRNQLQELESNEDLEGYAPLALGEAERALRQAETATGNEAYARTAREILTYVLRDMTSDGGGFYSAEDADSEGEEGKFYVWTTEEFHNALPDVDSQQWEACES